MRGNTSDQSGRLASRLILVAGIKRSGSTWMYNAVRLILKHAGKPHYATNRRNYDSSRKEPYHVLKIHKFSPEFADAAWKIFTSFRQIDEIKDSFKAFRGRELSDVDMSQMINDLLRYQAKSCYLLDYPDINNNPYDAVSQMAESLEVNVPLEPVLAELADLSPPMDRDFDDQTLLFRNHRRG